MTIRRLSGVLALARPKERFFLSLRGTSLSDDFLKSALRARRGLNPTDKASFGTLRALSWLHIEGQQAPTGPPIGCFRSQRARKAIFLSLRGSSPSMIFVESAF